VHGTAGLHVIDASVFPTSPGANPWLATVELATALGRHLSEDLATIDVADATDATDAGANPRR
jgi:choline dehydrogenase-like flavoprotein